MNYEDVHRLIQILVASFVADSALYRRILYVQPDECTEPIPEGKVVKVTIEYVDEAEARSDVEQATPIEAIESWKKPKKGAHA